MSRLSGHSNAVLVVVFAAALRSSAGAQTTFANFVEIPFGEALMADGPAAAVAGLGDLNGDGRGDFVLGFPQADTPAGVDAGRVIAISGADRSVLWSVDGLHAGDGLGRAVAAAGDVGGDGTPDVIAGAPYGPSPRYVLVLSGGDGSVLHTLHQEGGEYDDDFGEDVAGGADVDGDGRPDVIVGQLDDFGSVQVNSGATGALVIHIDDLSFWGQGSVSSFGDVDRDGHADFLIREQSEVNDLLTVRSGADGHVLKSFPDVGDACDAGDLDGDGVHDLLVGTGQIYSGELWTPLGTMQADGTPRAVGDVDGDGIADFALGSRVCSGGDGHLLFQAAHTGVLEPLGDVDGDGRLDLLGTTQLGFDAKAVAPAELLRNEPAVLLSSAVGEDVGAALGSSIANAGDLDGDGYADVLVGIPLDDAGGQDAGAVRLISGRDGATLLTLNGQAPLAKFGAAVASAGDIDGDSTVDIIVGAPLEIVGGSAKGSARVFSGADGHLLFATFGDSTGGRFGQAVAAAGDVDGDSHADVAVGAPRAPDVFQKLGRVTVFAGRDGSVLFSVDGTSALMQLGSALVCAGDADGDGHDELLAGAPGGTGSALLLSGDGGAVLKTYSGVAPEAKFGGSLDAVGDVDGDGAVDLLVGCVLDYVVDSSQTWHYSRVVGVSGSTGARTFTWTFAVGPANALPAVADAGDVDGDGTSDVIVGPRTGDGAGSAEVRSGETGATLLTLFGKPDDALGASVAGGGDTNGDGLADVLVGIPGDDTGDLDAGALRVLGFPAVVPPWTYLGQGLVGSNGLPLLLGAGSLQPAASTTLTLTGALPATRTALVVGTSAQAMPFKGGTLVPAPELVAWPILTNVAGGWSIVAHWPAGATPGTSLFFQAWIVDPGAISGFAASNALRADTP